MADSWIKMRVNLPRYPQVVRLASAFGADIGPLWVRMLSAVGALHATWALFDTHSADGMMRGYTLEALDLAVGVPGWGSAMVDVGWIVVSADGIRVPDWEKHNGTSAKRRAKEAERKEVSRRQVRSSSASDADKNRPPSSSSSLSPSLSSSGSGEETEEGGETTGFPWPDWVDPAQRDTWVQRVIDGAHALVEVRSSPAWLDGVCQAIAQVTAPLPGEGAIGQALRSQYDPAVEVLAWVRTIGGRGTGYATGALRRGPKTAVWQHPRLARDINRSTRQGAANAEA